MSHIIQTIGCKEVYKHVSLHSWIGVMGKHTLMLLVTRTGPEVTDLLGLDITRGKRRTLKRRSRDLQNWQRRSIVCQYLSDARNAGDQRRKGEALAQRNQRCQRCNSGLHFDFSFLKNRLDLVSIFERVSCALYRCSMPPSLAASGQVLISFHLLPFHLLPRLGPFHPSTQDRNIIIGTAWEISISQRRLQIEKLRQQ